MARTPSISPDKILRVARELFLEKGIRATTAEVARRAGVAEGSVFKHFKTKDKLFLACMEPGGLEDVPWIRTLSKRGDDPDIGRTLEEVGTQALDFFRAIIPLMIMNWSNQGGSPPQLMRPNPPPVRALKLLTKFFDTHLRAGRLRRRHNPQILARVFLGSLQNYAFFELILKGQSIVSMPADEYVRGVVELFLAGAQTSPEDRGKKPGTKTGTKPGTKKERR